MVGEPFSEHFSVDRFRLDDPFWKWASECVAKEFKNILRQQRIRIATLFYSSWYYRSRVALEMNARESDWNGKSRQTCASCNSLQVETIPFLFRRNNNSHQRQLHLVHNDTTVLLSLWIESTLGATISPSSSPLVPSPNGYGCASKWSGERPVIAPAPSTSLPFYLFLCWARLTLRHSWRQPDRLIRHS